MVCCCYAVRYYHFYFTLPFIYCSIYCGLITRSHLLCRLLLRWVRYGWLHYPTLLLRYVTFIDCYVGSYVVVCPPYPGLICYAACVVRCYVCPHRLIITARLRLLRLRITLCRCCRCVAATLYPCLTYTVGVAARLRTFVVLGSLLPYYVGYRCVVIGYCMQTLRVTGYARSPAVWLLPLLPAAFTWLVPRSSTVLLLTFCVGWLRSVITTTHHHRQPAFALLFCHHVRCCCYVGCLHYHAHALVYTTTCRTTHRCYVPHYRSLPPFVALPRARLPPLPTFGCCLLTRVTTRLRSPPAFAVITALRSFLRSLPAFLPITYHHSVGSLRSVNAHTFADSLPQFWCPRFGFFTYHPVTTHTLILPTGVVWFPAPPVLTTHIRLVIRCLPLPLAFVRSVLVVRFITVQPSHTFRLLLIIYYYYYRSLYSFGSFPPSHQFCAQQHTTPSVCWFLVLTFPVPFVIINACLHLPGLFALGSPHTTVSSL